jgi:hypothetical protein
MADPLLEPVGVASELTGATAPSIEVLEGAGGAEAQS